jgi:hypothetical protein
LMCSWSTQLKTHITLSHAGKGQQPR